MGLNIPFIQHFIKCLNNAKKMPGDYYTNMASLFYEIPIKGITSEQRQSMKTSTFAYRYGMSLEGLGPKEIERRLESGIVGLSKKDRKYLKSLDFDKVETAVVAKRRKGEEGN